jgi:hypothetical protein
LSLRRRRLLVGLLLLFKENSMDQDLIDAVKEAAVVAAMNAAIYGLSLKLPREKIDAGKINYLSKIKTELDETNKILFVSQLWEETIFIGPLYAAFTSAWIAPSVEKGLNEFCNSKGALGEWRIRLT